MHKLFIRYRSLLLKSASYILLNQFHTLALKETMAYRHEISKVFLASLNFQMKRVFVRNLYSLENKYYKEIKFPPTPLEVVNDYIKDVCFGETHFSSEKWDEVKVDIMNHCVSLTIENFDSVLMNVLMTHDKIDLAQSFMDYLKNRKLKPNFVTLCKYMVLCSQHTDLVNEDSILEMHDQITSVVNPNTMDSKTAECLIQGLCATRKWRLSVDYMNNVPESQWTINALDALACAAIRNNDYILYWKILCNWYKNDTCPGSKVFEDYIKQQIKVGSIDSQETDGSLSTLLKFVRDKGIILNEKTALSLETYFKSLKTHWWNVIRSKVDRNGICSVCQKRLEDVALTAKEFSQLRSTFLNYSLKKSDIFINTTDKEFSNYINFIEKFKPFDITLDGLNVAHSEQKVKNNRNLAIQLYDVVNHLSKGGNRILVLGRYHMKKWPQPIMSAIKHKAYIFYVSNVSQDDPFLIYAALASGPDALLMSHDMMRDHIARLPDSRSIYLFKKWQQSRQLYLAMGENDDIVIKGPLKHNINIQGSMESGWHIPYDNGYVREPYEELNNWLCIQRISDI